MHKVLIIKLGALGDVIMSTPLIRQIQEHHPNSEVFLLTSPPFADLLQHFQGLNIQSFQRHGLKASINTLVWIRKQRFSVVYDLQSNDRTSILCALSAVPRRIGNHPRFPYHCHPRQKWSGQCHIFERMLDVLRAGGIDAKYEKPFLPVTDNDEAIVEQWLLQHKLGGKRLILMHAGGSAQHPQKRWPYFSELAKHLESASYHVIWVGGHADAELNRTLAEVSGNDASDAFSLPQLTVLGERAHFAITNDSGPMHVLSCSDIPVYGLFGPTDWRRNHAIGQKDCVLSSNPETEPFTPQHLDELKVGVVLQRLRVDGHV